MLDYQQQDQWQPVSDYLQSPINIQSSTVELSDEFFSFKLKKPLLINQIENLGNNLRFNGSGTAEILHRCYQFKQLHFHHPAEHLIDGLAVSLEVHLVFENSIGQILVLALLFKVGKPNCLVQRLIDQKSGALKFQLPKDKVIYHYLGSLTTPSLQAGIEWFVITSSQLAISQKQLAWFTEHFLANARQIQPLQKRKIESLKN